MLRTKYPQFIDVRKVVEIWWDISCQTISIKPTVASKKSLTPMNVKEQTFNEEKVQQKQKTKQKKEEEEN